MYFLNFLEMEVARWLESCILGVFLMLLLIPCVSLFSEDLNFCSGKDWLKPRPDKTWPNTQFSHLWSGGDNGHAVSSLWSLRGMHGWLECVWVFETWQSFSSYLDAWNGSSLSLNIPLQNLQLRSGLQRQAAYVPSSDLICTLSPLSCLYFPAPKVIILQTENSSDKFSVSHRLSPLLCLWPCAPTRIHLSGLWNLKVLFTLCLFPEPPLPTRWDQAFNFPVLPMHVFLLLV